MLKNISLANQVTGTVFGQLKFDEKGECRQLTPEQEKELAHCIGFEVVEEKKEEPKDKEEAPKAKKPAAKKVVKEEE